MNAASNKLVNRDEITDVTVSAFADSSQIPEKYIRTDEVLGGFVVSDNETHELPVVDMASLLDPELSKLETVKLGSACRHWGFFQLTNHGIDEAVIQHMKENTAQFFSLPLDSKKTVAVRGDGFEGYGHHYTRSSATGGDKLDWAESVIFVTQPVQDRNMPLWPANPPTFRNALETYSVEITNALVVNVGDILHIITNGTYKSVEHRVLVDAQRARTTAEIFQDASVDGMVTPLPELLKGGQARYKSIERFQYLKVRFSALAKGAGFLDSFRA
ncbi:hypothetical protein EJB05_05952, partial [Eragrostis curvula]